MEEGYILISWLNDYLFCPYSIYLHQIYTAASPELYHETAQWQGGIAHESLDEQHYSTHKDVRSGLAVASQEFGLYGKIDLYKGGAKELIERKRKISAVYDGYVYQLLGQYYCTREMGYEMEKLSLYSMVDNKKYAIPLPDAAKEQEFAQYVEKLRSYRPAAGMPNANPKKCKACIYSELCTECMYM